MAAGTQPPNSTSDSEGRRWYTHPVKRDPDGQPERFLSVTTALKGVAKDALVPWAGWGTARLALDHLPKLLAAARRDSCGQAGAMRCRQCPDCVTLWLAEWQKRESAEASDRGRRVHHAIKLWIEMDGTRRRLDDDVQPYFDQFLRFVKDHRLTPVSFLVSECTVLDRENGLAGTLDAICRFDASDCPPSAELVARVTGKLSGSASVMLDWKTRDADTARFYQDMALQLAGYRGAPVVMMPDGREYPTPKTDGAAVVQLRPDGYEVRPVDASESAREALLAYARGYRWTIEHGTAAVSPLQRRVPDEMAGTKAAGKRVEKARKAAAKAPGSLATATTGPAGAPGTPTATGTARKATKATKAARKTTRPATKTAAAAATPPRTLAQRILGEPVAPDPDALPGMPVPGEEEIPF